MHNSGNGKPHRTVGTVISPPPSHLSCTSRMLRSAWRLQRQSQVVRTGASDTDVHNTAYSFITSHITRSHCPSSLPPLLLQPIHRPSFLPFSGLLLLALKPSPTSFLHLLLLLLFLWPPPPLPPSLLSALVPYFAVRLLCGQVVVTRGRA